MKGIDIIWNITRLCPWDCAICCVDATHVTKHADKVVIKEHGLSKTTMLDKAVGSDIYEQALLEKLRNGDELGISQKKKIIDNISKLNPRLDISGGDPLIVKDNLDLLKYASNALGKNNITITATCSGLAKTSIEHVAQNIGELNITIDPSSARPDGYFNNNLKALNTYIRNGVKVRAELPLTTETCKPDVIKEIYNKLKYAGVSSLLVMRLFPVGRGKHHELMIPSKAEYLSVLRILSKLEKESCMPRIHLQCALKQLVEDGDNNPCDMVKSSLGLMPDGTLLASPWAIDQNGKPLHPVWILGNLREESLKAIIKSNKYLEYINRSDTNYGHCKIFSYIYSKKRDPFERIHDNSDPLYT